MGGGRWEVGYVCVCVYTMSMACPIQFVCPSHLSTGVCAQLRSGSTQTRPEQAPSLHKQHSNKKESLSQTSAWVEAWAGFVSGYRGMWNVGESQDVPTLSTSSFPPLPPPPSPPSLPSCSEEVRVVQTRQSKLYSWWSNLRENNPITNCKGATVLEQRVDCVGGHSYRVECRVCVRVYITVW